MSSVVPHPRRRRLSWHTRLVLVCAVVVVLSLVVSPVMPPIVTTVTALVAGTGFVLGVSASISAFLDRDGYGDSDFWR